jgi:hypothetical protein
MTSMQGVHAAPLMPLPLAGGYNGTNDMLSKQSATPAVTKPFTECAKEVRHQYYTAALLQPLQSLCLTGRFNGLLVQGFLSVAQTRHSIEAPGSSRLLRYLWCHSVV